MEKTLYQRKVLLFIAMTLMMWVYVLPAAFGSISTSILPTIDGSATEWTLSNSTRIPVNGGYIHLMNDANYLYVLLDVTADTVNDDTTSLDADYFWLTFDVNRNSALDSGIDVNFDTLLGTATLCIQTYSSAGNWNNCSTYSNLVVASGFGTSVNAPSTPHRIKELQIPRNLINAVAPNSPLRFALKLVSLTPSFNYDTPANFFSDFSTAFLTDFTDLTFDPVGNWLYHNASGNEGCSIWSPSTTVGGTYHLTSWPNPPALGVADGDYQLFPCSGIPGMATAYVNYICLDKTKTDAIYYPHWTWVITDNNSLTYVPTYNQWYSNLYTGTYMARGCGGNVTYYTMTYKTSTGGTINGSLSTLTQTVNPNVSGPTVKAIPFPGYYFTGWNDGSTANPRTDINANVDATAIFNLISSSTTLTKADPPGGTYNVTQYVNFTQIGTQSGTVYYTLDGSDPRDPNNTNRVQYNNNVDTNNQPLPPVPAAVSQSKTLKFAATPGGTTWEPVKTEVYTINPIPTGASITLTPSTENDPYPAGNIPVTVTFPQIDNTIKPDCFSNTHFELFPCVLSETTQCDPLPSLCRIRQAYGPGDVGNIAAGETLNCNLGDMYDPSILNQLTAGNYTIKATYSNYIPINLNLDALPPAPKTLWTGAIELTSSPINLYKFTGFLPPVDNPTVWNVAKAGRAIPIKWKIQDQNNTGNTGMVVSIKGIQILCPGATEMPSDDIEIYDPDTQASLLQCASDGSCQFDWKTTNVFPNSCYVLILKLTDSTERTANFLFKSK